MGLLVSAYMLQALCNNMLSHVIKSAIKSKTAQKNQYKATGISKTYTNISRLP